MQGGTKPVDCGVLSKTRARFALFWVGVGKAVSAGSASPQGLFLSARRGNTSRRPEGRNGRRKAFCRRERLPLLRPASEAACFGEGRNTGGGGDRGRSPDAKRSGRRPSPHGDGAQGARSFAEWQNDATACAGGRYIPSGASAPRGIPRPRHGRPIAGSTFERRPGRTTTFLFGPFRPKSSKVVDAQ